MTPEEYGVSFQRQIFAIESRLSALESAAKPVTVPDPMQHVSFAPGNPDPIQPSHIFCPSCNGSGRDNVPYGETCDTCNGNGEKPTTIPATPDPEAAATCKLCGEPAMDGGVYCKDHSDLRRCCRCHRPMPSDMVPCGCKRPRSSAEIAVEIAESEVERVNIQPHARTWDKANRHFDLINQYRAAVEREGGRG